MCPNKQKRYGRQEALEDPTNTPFTIDDLRVLTYFVGCGPGGPEDQALGEKMLGSIQHVDGSWRWTFENIGSDVHGDLHDNIAAADDLANMQAHLFPADLPLDDWFDGSKTTSLIQRTKNIIAITQKHRVSVVGQVQPDLMTRVVLPRDVRTLRNDFPGFLNLGNTCFLNAVLRCMFRCGPLGADLFHAPMISVSLNVLCGTSLLSTLLPMIRP